MSPIREVKNVAAIDRGRAGVPGSGGICPVGDFISDTDVEGIAATLGHSISANQVTRFRRALNVAASEFHFRRRNPLGILPSKSRVRVTNVEKAGTPFAHPSEGTKRRLQRIAGDAIANPPSQPARQQIVDVLKALGKAALELQLALEDYQQYEGLRRDPASFRPLPKRRKRLTEALDAMLQAPRLPSPHFSAWLLLDVASPESGGNPFFKLRLDIEEWDFDDPNLLQSVCITRQIVEEAVARAAALPSSSGRRPDDILGGLCDALIRIYRELTGRRATYTRPVDDGPPSGPLIEFLMKVAEMIQIKVEPSTWAAHIKINQRLEREFQQQQVLQPAGQNQRI